MSEEYTVSPVATVHRDDDQFPDGPCTIEVLPEFRPAMLHIEPGDRLQVLFWMNRLSEQERSVLQVHPQGRQSRPLHGVFAVRSPMRPNPIGSAVVDVVEVRDDSLVVTGLDAYDGSPVIDMKSAPRRKG